MQYFKVLSRQDGSKEWTVAGVYLGRPEAEYAKERLAFYEEHDELLVIRSEAQISPLEFEREVSRGKVLVVEGVRQTRIQIIDFLRELGFEYRTSPTGSQAIEMCIDQTYDAIFMDTDLTGMSSLEATMKIRRLGGVANYIPMIGTESYSSIVAKQKCYSAGMDYFLAKPIQKSQLQTALDFVVGSDRENLRRKLRIHPSLVAMP